MDIENLDALAPVKTDLQNNINKKNKNYQSYQKQKEKVFQLNFLKSNLETYMQWREPEINKKMEH